MIPRDARAVSEVTDGYCVYFLITFFFFLSSGVVFLSDE